MILHLFYCLSFEYKVLLIDYYPEQLFYRKQNQSNYLILYQYLKAFSHNPADDSFAPLPGRTDANTKYLNERFLSY